MYHILDETMVSSTQPSKQFFSFQKNDKKGLIQSIVYHVTLAQPLRLRGFLVLFRLIDSKWLKSILPRTWEWSFAGWGGVGMVPSLPFSPLLDARACLFPSLPKEFTKNILNYIKIQAISTYYVISMSKKRTHFIAFTLEIRKQDKDKCQNTSNQIKKRR